MPDQDTTAPSAQNAQTPSAAVVELRDVEAAEQAAREQVMRYASGAVLALSGGADSALLLSLAAEVIPTSRVLGVTSRSESLPHEELAAAVAQCDALGVEHLAMPGSELDVEAFRRNAPDRCFHCKTTMYTDLRKIADERGLPAVLDGTNADDGGDHRPGLAAGILHDVKTPLADAGLSKVWVREVSRRRGLATWDKPAEACLSSRFPYGTTVTREGLARVAQAERVLKDLGFRTVRVRVHDPIARVEVPVSAFPRLMEPACRAQVVGGLKALGFTFVAFDLEGFRSGSLNEPRR